MAAAFDWGMFSLEHGEAVTRWNKISAGSFAQVVSARLISYRRGRGYVAIGRQAMTAFDRLMCPPPGEIPVAIKLPHGRRSSRHAVRCEEKTWKAILHNLRPTAAEWATWKSLVTVPVGFRAAGSTTFLCFPRFASCIIDHPVALIGRDWRACNGTACMVAAVALLHSRGWVHGDIKPDNILIRAATSAADDDDEANPPSAPRSSRAVLCDFGNAHPAPGGPHAALAVLSGNYVNRGTFAYAAPEVIGQAAECTKGVVVYPPSADVWSLGMTLLLLESLCNSMTPVIAVKADSMAAILQHADVVAQLQDPAFWDTVEFEAEEAEDLRPVLQNMLRRDPAERWTIGAVAASPPIARRLAALREWRQVRDGARGAYGANALSPDGGPAHGEMSLEDIAAPAPEAAAVELPPVAVATLGSDCLASPKVTPAGTRTTPPRVAWN